MGGAVAAVPEPGPGKPPAAGKRIPSDQEWNAASGMGVSPMSEKQRQGRDGPGTHGKMPVPRPKRRRTNMLLYNFQQYWWLWAGLAAGVAVTVIIVLTYFPLWRKREPAAAVDEAAPAPQACEASSNIPWCCC